MDRAPRWNGTTPAIEGVVDPPPVVGWMTTLLAVMVVPLVVPSTRTLTPFLMALAELELVPLRYFAEDAFLTVTF